ncbi:hypothetical protein K443DRAFT_580383 [Laccaria amethystina LaAM-08-1]|uniref:Uncharacterized protein n=1 Tax=Laccaria amethystina LaAM-08-1 TaxID=1095629 RepID=A0A0C9WRE6_9AGAR|nr:hypothetical protein K443DRAFT_580383 [Laccaria amethystina LaAM-08-1]
MKSCYFSRFPVTPGAPTKAAWCPNFRDFLHMFEFCPAHPSYTVDVIPLSVVHFRLDELIKKFKRGDEPAILTPLIGLPTLNRG